MLWAHVLFVGLLVGTELFFTALSVLNLRYEESAVTDAAEWIDERLNVDDPDRMLDYHRLKTGLGLLQTWIGLGALLGVLYVGLYADAVRLIEATGWHPIVQGVAFFIGGVFAVRLFGVPFDLVDTFVTEEIFGFNQQTPTLWVRDFFVGLAVTLVLTAIAGAALMAVLQWLPTWWWVGAWGLFVAFSLAMLVIYPRVIAPLFNDFEPIETGDLREAIEDVFERAGFSTSGIYEMDASRRSSHSNAYFIGFGRTKRVVLFDTLIEQMDHRQIQSVLAHELAHWKKAHIWKRLGSSALRTGIVLAVLAVLIESSWLYTMFGVPTGVEYAGLVLAGLLISPVNRLLSPIENRLSLKHEREADSFAVDVMGEGEPMIEALCRLTSENLSNPFPHPLYATFHYTHPPVPERIRYIQELPATEDEGFEPGESGEQPRPSD